MDIYADPAYAMATEQFQVIADYLELDENVRARMLNPKRAIAVTLPIRFDDGHVLLGRPAADPDAGDHLTLVGERYTAAHRRVSTAVIDPRHRARRRRPRPQGKRLAARPPNQDLQVLHSTALVTRARDRRQVLYRRTPLAGQLTANATRTP